MSLVGYILRGRARLLSQFLPREVYLQMYISHERHLSLSVQEHRCNQVGLIDGPPSFDIIDVPLDTTLQGKSIINSPIEAAGLHGMTLSLPTYARSTCNAVRQTAVDICTYIR